jgi:hypothetical protein
MAGPDPPSRTPLLFRWLLLLLAVASLALGVLGLFLPVVPTVPFVLLAAWAAARSSPRLSRWLENHPRLGPYIADWRHGGAVRRRAKWTASALMSISAAGMLLWIGPRWQVFAAIGVLGIVLVWLWRRPEAPPD